MREKRGMNSEAVRNRIAQWEGRAVVVAGAPSKDQVDCGAPGAPLCPSLTPDIISTTIKDNNNFDNNCNINNNNNNKDAVHLNNFPSKLILDVTEAPLDRDPPPLITSTPYRRGMGGSLTPTSPVSSVMSSRSSLHEISLTDIDDPLSSLQQRHQDISLTDLEEPQPPPSLPYEPVTSLRPEMPNAPVSQEAFPTLNGSTMPVEVSTTPPTERQELGTSSSSTICSPLSEVEEPLLNSSLLRDTQTMRLTTPVRNAAVQKYWQQQTLKLELELKEEKVSALNRELDDLNSSGKVEEEVSTLKRAKHELELRIKDQEEELDDLAGQVQMLEGAKVRLEMSIEQMRKENRKEIQNREEELDEVRMGAQKKIKALEQQIENEHEERTLLVRERHELERRIADLQERTITSIDEDYVHKIKKELKKTKVLLKDTQTMLDKAQSEGSSKLLVRQLKTQLEDAEFAKTAAIKARQSAEADLQELQASLDEAQRLKKDAEERTGRLIKDKSELQTQLDESEEEVAEVMKKYKATVSQLSVDQISLSEQSQLISELEHEKQMMHDRLNEMTSKVEVLEGETANIHTQRRLEMKIKEMESKLELELTTRQRLESQIGRLKDQMERLGGECESSKLKESQSIDHSKKLGRQLREAKEDLSTLQQRYTDVSNKKQETEKQMELQDSEIATLKSDLKLAFKRIEEFQQALQGDLSDSDSDISDSDSDSDAGSLSSYLTASLRQHTRSSSNSTLRTPPSELQQERGEPAHSPTSEGAMSMISEDEEFNTKESFA